MGDPSRRLNEYISSFSQAIDAKDGNSFVRLLRITGNEDGYGAIVSAGLDAVRDAPRNLHHMPDNLGDMALHHMKAMRAHHQRKHVEAYVELYSSANLFLPVFRNWETAWAMGSMHRMAFELRVLAQLADDELVRSGKSADKLKSAGPFLMKVFGAIAGKGSKRTGALYIACQLFKIYFRLGTLNLSKSIIRVIDASKGFGDFPIRDQVTYRYYTGRMDVFNDNFIAADEKLSFALAHCDKSKMGNQRRILKYLIPVKLSLGLLPSHPLLSRFQLTEYEGIVKAIRTGDIRLLRSTLEEQEDRFLRAGVFLVLEKLEFIVFRRLVKKIHLIQKAKDAARGHQVRMDGIVRALKWLQVDMDIDEVECITANLIFLGLMKGYISHKSKVIVLSKQDPFPSTTGKIF